MCCVVQNQSTAQLPHLAPLKHNQAWHPIMPPPPPPPLGLSRTLAVHLSSNGMLKPGVSASRPPPGSLIKDVAVVV